MIANDRPVSPLRAAVLAGLAMLLAIASWTDVGVLASPPPQEGAAAAAGPSDNEKQRITIQRTREVGVAMFSWLTDVIAEGVDMSESVDAAAADGPEPATADWSVCPAISYEDLAKVLVPTYIRELPRTDGFGHPLEYCLNQQRPGDPRYVAGIRSPGRDGRFEGDVYPIGSFDPEVVDRDVVWIDGYFIIWPQKAE